MDTYRSDIDIAVYWSDIFEAGYRLDKVISWFWSDIGDINGCRSGIKKAGYRLYTNIGGKRPYMDITYIDHV